PRLPERRRLLDRRLCAALPRLAGHLVPAAVPDDHRGSAVLHLVREAGSGPRLPAPGDPPPRGRRAPGLGPPRPSAPFGARVGRATIDEASGGGHGRGTVTGHVVTEPSSWTTRTTTRFGAPALAVVR